MRKRQNNLIQYPIKRFIRYSEACERYGLKREYIREIAMKAGSLYQLSEHVVLIDMLAMDSYLEKNFKVKGDYKNYGIF